MQVMSGGRKASAEIVRTISFRMLHALTPKPQAICPRTPYNREEGYTMKMSNSEARRHARRHNRVEIKLSDEELDVIRKRAGSLGLSVSAYLRRIGTVGEVISFDFSMWKDFIWALGEIGNNINQIAKVANSTQSVSDKYLRQIISQQEFIPSVSLR